MTADATALHLFPLDRSCNIGDCYAAYCSRASSRRKRSGLPRLTSQRLTNPSTLGLIAYQDVRTQQLPYRDELLAAIGRRPPIALNVDDCASPHSKT